MSLSQKQQLFCEYYLVDSNATLAAKRAGYSEKTAGSQGSNLLKNPNIQAYLKERNIDIQTETDFTIEKIMRDLEDVRIQAFAKEQFSAAIRASELQGKQIGMFIDRKDLAQFGDKIVVEFITPNTIQQERENAALRKRN
ncbi:terminase small subunit [candidate division KSB1 bacterium]